MFKKMQSSSHNVTNTHFSSTWQWLNESPENVTVIWCKKNNSEKGIWFSAGVIKQPGRHSDRGPI